MRILLVAQLYSPYVSGSARLLQDIVEHLAAQRHDVEVLTLDLPMFGDCAGFDSQQHYIVHRLKPWKIRGSTSMHIAAKLMSLTMRGKYDLILCGFASPIAMIARAVSFFTRVPYAVYTHGEDVVAARDELRRRPLGRALKGAKVVMCNSSFSAAEVLWFGVPPERVKIIAPGIDSRPYLDVSAERVQALRKRLGLGEEAKVLLTLARLDARKGHDMVIQALPAVAAAVPDVHYLIVGKGDPEGMYQLASKLGVRDRLSIFDYVAGEELPALFTACDVYVMPSRLDPVTRQVEGFGIVYLEAAACGKPSVAGRQGGCADAVVDGVTGVLVDTGDRADIAQALIRLLQHPMESSRMGETGRFRVQEQFNKATQLQAIETQLLQCLTA